MRGYHFHTGTCAKTAYIDNLSYLITQESHLSNAKLAQERGSGRSKYRMCRYAVIMV